MKKSDKDLSTQSNEVEPQELFPKTLIDKPVRPHQESPTQIWLAGIMPKMKRMSIDEQYRREIAKRLS